MDRRFFIATFGCRVNQYESEQIREGLANPRCQLTDDWHQADLCIVNTCSVTESADKDARRIIRKICRGNPGAQLVITGCYASRAAGELRELAPKALFVSNLKKETIPLLAGSLHRTAAIGSFWRHTRAYIKVQDGCRMRCSYCIVPIVRPVVKSRSWQEILNEIQKLFQAGYREFVLCGIRLGRYFGAESAQVHRCTSAQVSEKDRVGLIDLIKRIAELPGDFRIRLSSIEVADLTDRFIGEYVQTPKTVPYFHVPLQSASDDVLRAMKRPYTSGFYRKRIEAIRKILGHNVAIFTDLMIGFPTETEDQFKESLNFVNDSGLAGLHIFRFSRREGTPAARLESVYSPRQLKERLMRSHEADRRLRADFAKRFVGQKLPVLWETSFRHQGRQKGRAENFLEVAAVKASRQINSPTGQLSNSFRLSSNWETVRIDAAHNGRLVAYV